MKLLNPDGSEFGDMPDWLLFYAKPPVFTVLIKNRNVAFVWLSHGLRFYDVPDREAWVEGDGEP